MHDMLSGAEGRVQSMSCLVQRGMKCQSNFSFCCLQGCSPKARSDVGSVNGGARS